MNEGIVIVFQLVVLIFSVMVHEISHGAMALKLGDTTAKDAGRLTLNPVKHIDPFGSVILPLLMALPALFGGPVGPIFGWAKPVPYNPWNLKNPKAGAGIIAAAGPLSNLTIAAVFGVLARFAAEGGALLGLFQLVILINISLAFFNLIPIPPLDGSNILFAFFPDRSHAFRAFLTRYGLFILLAYIFFGFPLLGSAVEFFYRLFTGA